MNILNILYIVLVIFITIIYFSAFKNGKPTCNNYILNNYLYLIISLIFLIILILNLQKTKFDISNNRIMYVLYFIFTLFIAVLLSKPSKNYLYKHILLILFISLLALSTSVFYKNIDIEQFIKISIQSGIILIVLTILAIQFPHFFKDNYLPYLMFTLPILIISYMIDSIFYNNDNNKQITYFSVVIFSLLMVYDTKKIIFTKLCNPIDYTNTTASLFMDIINMFQNLYILDN